MRTMLHHLLLIPAIAGSLPPPTNSLLGGDQTSALRSRPRSIPFSAPVVSDEHSGGSENLPDAIQRLADAIHQPARSACSPAALKRRAEMRVDMTASRLTAGRGDGPEVKCPCNHARAPHGSPVNTAELPHLKHAEHTHISVSASSRLCSADPSHHGCSEAARARWDPRGDRGQRHCLAPLKEAPTPTREEQL